MQRNHVVKSKLNSPLPGFEPSKTDLYACKCEFIHRYKNLYLTAMLQRITPLNNTGNIDFFIHLYYPLDYCLPPTIDVSINFNKPNGADAQCNHNRSGTLCSICQPGLSLSLGSSRCIDCPRYWPALVLSLIHI